MALILAYNSIIEIWQETLTLRLVEWSTKTNYNWLMLSFFIAYEIHMLISQVTSRVYYISGFLKYRVTNSLPYSLFFIPSFK